jgi:hypothetical protein
MDDEIVVTSTYYCCSFKVALPLQETCTLTVDTAAVDSAGLSAGDLVKVLILWCEGHANDLSDSMTGLNEVLFTDKSLICPACGGFRTNYSSGGQDLGT